LSKSSIEVDKVLSAQSFANLILRYSLGFDLKVLACFALKK